MVTVADPAEREQLAARGRYRRPESTALGSLVVAAGTVVSRVTGLMRVVAIGAVLGPTFVANAFVATNNVPNLTYSVVAGPVLALVVVPSVVRSLLQRSPLESTIHVRRLSSLLLTASCGVALLVALASPLLAWTLTLGVPAPAQGRARFIAVVLLLLVVPQVVLYTVAALGAAAQQARQRYGLASTAPAVENIGLLVTMGVVAHLDRHTDEVGTVPMRLVLVLGLGATASVALHAALQAAGARAAGLSLLPARRWWSNPEVREVGSRLRRSVFVAGLPAASIYVLLAVAATVPGGVVVFQTAYLVYGVPIAIGARAVTTAVLPPMSAAVAGKDAAGYARTWRQALLYGIGAGLPALCVLAVFADPVAGLLAQGDLHRPVLIGWLTVCVAVLAVSQLPGGLFEIGRQALFARLDVRGPQLAGWTAFAATLVGAAAAALLPAGLPRLVGLCVAVLLTDATAAGTVLALVHRHIRPERSLDLRRVGALLLAALTMVPVLALGRTFTGSGGGMLDLAVLVACAAAATAVYAGTLFMRGRLRRSREAGVGARPHRRRPWQAAVGHGVDVVAAAALLLLLAVPLLCIAAWLRLDSRGPALLRQERVGLAGRRFTVYKFRTMSVGCDDAVHRRQIEAELRGEDTLCDGTTKVPRDQRVTRAGRFLRRTSLDELPQLINVLRGDMALVGPRPCLPWEAEMFPTEFAERFSVRPGLTGLWQVSGRSTLGTLDMLRLDLAYVRDRSLGRDLRILARTVPALLRGGGAR
jgi:lipopolysaccharide/colanic/teichoic acid biosynthesis glycosyltransferase/peptidoglycan biosynthesis protein MviN/MurJ (putative lipid II flippase)